MFYNTHWGTWKQVKWNAEQNRDPRISRTGYRLKLIGSPSLYSFLEIQNRSEHIGSKTSQIRLRGINCRRHKEKQPKSKELTLIKNARAREYILKFPYAWARFWMQRHAAGGGGEYSGRSAQVVAFLLALQYKGSFLCDTFAFAPLVPRKCER